MNNVKLKYNDFKNKDSYELLVASIGFEVVEIIQIYSKEKLSDDLKEKIFDTSVNSLMDYRESEFEYTREDIMNNIILDLHSIVSNMLNIKQVDDLKDSYINN